MIKTLKSSRIQLLAIAHIALGLCLCAFAGTMGTIPFVLEFLPIVPHLAMVLSQACLLAIWAVLGTTRKELRMAGFLFGVLYLELVLYLGTQNDDFSWLAAFSSCSVAAVLLVSRIWFAPLVHLDADSSSSSVPKFQFSIRGLMLLTLSVALFITGAKMINELVGGPSFLEELLLWGAAVATTGLAASWATLTAADPAPRSALVVMLSLAAAALVGYGFDEGWHAYFYLITITALQAVIVLGSLLVVRSSGFRLVRQPRASPESGGRAIRSFERPIAQQDNAP